MGVFKVGSSIGVPVVIELDALVVMAVLVIGNTYLVWDGWTGFPARGGTEARDHFSGTIHFDKLLKYLAWGSGISQSPFLDCDSTALITRQRMM